MEKHKHHIRVGFADCDPALMVYTGRLPCFCLDAIDTWWENCLGGDGWYQLNLDRNLGTPFVHMSLNILKPVTPRNELTCTVWPTKLGNTSIAFQVDGEQAGTLCFQGSFVCVFVVADAFEKTQPPKSIRDLVTPFLAPPILHKA